MYICIIYIRYNVSSSVPSSIRETARGRPPINLSDIVLGFEKTSFLAAIYQLLYKLLFQLWSSKRRYSSCPVSLWWSTVTQSCDTFLSQFDGFLLLSRTKLGWKVTSYWNKSATLRLISTKLALELFAPKLQYSFLSVLGIFKRNK